jgi:tetratricopeptide (TPR) repeat protein
MRPLEPLRAANQTVSECHVFYVERDRAAVLDAALEKETNARMEADRATRRARWLAVAATLVTLVAVVASIITVLSLAAGAAAYEQKARAEAAREKAILAMKAADDLISFMQYDLSDRLGKIGRLDTMDAINARIRKYHEDRPPEPRDAAARDAADRERSVVLDQQGNILRDQGQLAEALKAYRASLEIRASLTKKNPDTTLWQSDLSASYGRVGDVQSAQGDLVGALKSYRESLGIAEKLAKQDPGNATWQRDLAVAYWRTGSAWVEAEPKSKNEARAMVEKGTRHLAPVEGAHRLDCQSARMARLDRGRPAEDAREEMTVGEKQFRKRNF